MRKQKRTGCREWTPKGLWRTAPFRTVKRAEISDHISSFSSSDNKDLKRKRRNIDLPRALLKSVRGGVGKGPYKIGSRSEMLKPGSHTTMLRSLSASWEMLVPRTEKDDFGGVLSADWPLEPPRPTNSEETSLLTGEEEVGDRKTALIQGKKRTHTSSPERRRHRNWGKRV